MIFGFGKKQAKQLSSQETYKQRVAEFWQWYPQVADQIFQLIESGDTDALTELVAPYMERTLPGLAWVFGAGEPGGHSFTLTGEGIVPKQILAEYWHSRARQIPRWTFHASRQSTPPAVLKDFAISIKKGQTVDVVNFLIQATANTESEAIDIVGWHPNLEKLPKEDQMQILFLLLDEALGEFGTETWLGDIKVEPFDRDKSTVTIVTLPEKIRQVSEYYKWEKTSPLESYSLYEVDKQTNAPRGDTLFGTTCIPNVVLEYLERKGKLRDNPLEETGAHFAFVSLDGSLFPSGQEVEVRSSIENALNDALRLAESGITCGGAFGAENSYIDLLLFDGASSEAIVSKVLEQLQLSERSKFQRMS
jgi:hypothetical protein